MSGHRSSPGRRALSRGLGPVLVWGLSGCITAPETPPTETPDVAKTCPEPDAFAAQFTQTRVTKWRDALVAAMGRPGVEVAAAWPQLAMQQLELARAEHRSAFERSCVASLVDDGKDEGESDVLDVEAWSQHRTCFAEARAGIRARYELAADWAQRAPEKLSLAPQWPWRASSSVARCAVHAVALTYQAVDPKVADPKRIAAQAQWVQTYALAELGDLESATVELATLDGLLRDGIDERLSFEANLLGGWLALAAGDTETAEAMLAPTNTAAQALGEPSRLDQLFFAAAVAHYAADDDRARGHLRSAVRISGELAVAHPAAFAPSHVDARLQLANAWLADDPERARALASEVLGELEAAAPERVEPTTLSWARELAGVEG